MPALLSIYGGKITTYRRLAEAALAMLSSRLSATSRPAGWTGRQPLPGGDFPVDGFEALLTETAAQYPFLAPATLRRLVRAYGTRAGALLDGAKSQADLGRNFGADLTEAEVRYLAREEWAMTAEDIVWRRSKLGLRMSKSEIAELEACLRAPPASPRTVE
jgi:glycerol-3-phosphate dehydrogenase